MNRIVRITMVFNKEDETLIYLVHVSQFLTCQQYGTFDTSILIGRLSSCCPIKAIVLKVGVAVPSGEYL